MDIRTLRDYLDSAAMNWWKYTVVARVAVFLMGVVVLLIPALSGALVILASVINIASVFMQMRSDYWKAAGQRAARSYEWQDGMGVEISPAARTDLLSCVSDKNLIKEIVNSTRKYDYDYYSSPEKPGIRRLIDIHMESALWSKTEAREMAKYVGGIVALVVFAALFILIFTVINVLDHNSQENIGKVIMSAIVFTFTAGFVRLPFDYQNFAKQAENIEREAETFLKINSQDEKEGIRISHNYQLARASAPLLPPWIYWRVKDKANILWEQRRVTR